MQLLRAHRVAKHHPVACGATAPTVTTPPGLMGSVYARSRACFGYFSDTANNPAFLENAGGSQVPRSVIDAICNYMTNSYAQLSAGHAISDRADATIRNARHFMRTFMNAHDVGQVALGPSTSRLVASLAHCYGTVMGPEDEIVVQESGHESNIGPWWRLAESKGAPLHVWKVDKGSLTSHEEDLEKLLSPRTRIVALSHVSNLLGDVLDLTRVVQLVKKHAPAARIVVDGVAYAPHRAVDVAAWGVDYYVVSNYKVWGPHMATMFVSNAAAAELVAAGGTAHGPNHYFVPQTNLVYALEVGGVNHEGCAGLLGLQDYLEVLAAAADGDASPPSQQLSAAPAPTPAPAPAAYIPRESYLTRQQVEAAYKAMADMEAGPQRLLLEFLTSRSDVRVIGPVASDSGRVPTVSFVHERLLPSRIAADVNASGYAIRNGHMYARRLVEALVAGDVIKPLGGKDSDAAVNEGVVRISMLHYNTPSEVEGLIGVLKRVLASSNA